MDYIKDITVPSWLISYSLMALHAVPYLLLCKYLYELGKYVYAYVMTLRIECKPNEWAVVMQKGEQVKAGIGLAGFRGPYD